MQCIVLPATNAMAPMWMQNFGMVPLSSAEQDVLDRWGIVSPDARSVVLLKKEVSSPGGNRTIDADSRSDGSERMVTA